MTLRVGLVGLGDIAQIHLNAIDEQRSSGVSRLEAVCDIHEDRAIEIGSRYGVLAFNDAAQMLEEVPLDLLHICTPNDIHAELATAALSRGLHVLLEQPVAHTVSDAVRLVEAAASAKPRGQHTIMCFQHRYHPTVLALAEELRSGRRGRVLGARAELWWHRDARYFRRAQWRGQLATAGGGVLLNEAGALVDLLIHLLGEAVTTVGTASRQGCPGDVQVEDAAAVRILHRGPHGDVPSILFGTTGHFEDAPVALEVGTESGLLRIDGLELTFTDHHGSTTVLATDPPRNSWGTTHPLLIADVHRRLDRGDASKTAWATPAEALASLRIATDVYAAASVCESVSEGAGRPNLTVLCGDAS